MASDANRFEDLQRSITLHLMVASRAADMLAELAAEDGALEGIYEDRNRGSSKFRSALGPFWYPATVTNVRSLRSRIKGLHREITSLKRLEPGTPVKYNGVPYTTGHDTKHAL